MNLFKFINTVNETEPEMARREYLTRQVLFISFCVAFSFALISFILYITGQMPLDTLIIYSAVTSILVVAMFLAEAGFWRGAGIIPPLLMYFPAVNANYIGGIDAPGNFMYALLIIFVAIIYGHRKIWIALVICLVTYLCLAWLISSGYIKPFRTAEVVFANRVVLTSGFLVGIALMIWLLGRSYKSEIDVRIRVEELLKGKNEELVALNEAMQKSEERYKSLVENADEAILVIQDGMIKFVNTRAVESFGYSVQEFLAIPVFELVHPEDRNAVIERYLQKIGGDTTPTRHTYKSIHKGGHIAWIEISSVLIDWGGRPATLNLITDITKRKQAEETLRQSESRYHFLAESMADVVFTLDMDLVTTYVSPSIERMLGFTPEERMAQTVDQQLTPKSQKLVLETLVTELERDKEKGVDSDRSQTMELEYYHKNGSIKYLVTYIRGIRDAEGNLMGFYGSHHDITNRKHAEEALRQSEEKYRRITENMSDIVTEVDAQGIIQYISPSHRRLFGVNPENLIDQAAFDGVHPEDRDRAVAEFMEGVHAKTDRALEYRYRHADGHYIWLRSSGHPLYDASGEFIGAIISTSDITDRKWAEEELHRTLESLRKSFAATIQVMSSAVESRDPYTAGHQIRAADLARAIATEMRLPQEKIDGLRMAGTIHDIGKLSIPSEILSKPTKLSKLEFSLIKEHSSKGFEMLKDVESPWPLAEIVYQHHERMDGSGYPRHLKGEEIMMEARILAVADVVEAMATHRPYRPALGLNAALAEIESHKGTLYDQEAVVACLRLFKEKGFQFKTA